VLVSLRVRDLLLASWRTDRESVARTLPAGLEPAEVDGEHLVSLVALRYAGGRLAGRLPIPPFSQLNVRVYAAWQGEPAVVFLDARVTLLGLGATLLGAPYRTARLCLRPGRADAPGLGVRIRYRPGGPADPGELGRHELGLFPAGRELRGFRVRRGPVTWRSAVPTEPVRADPLHALGFDVREPASLLYAEGASFEVDAPPRRMTSTRSSGSSQ
jgi:hypothetical protein